MHNPKYVLGQATDRSSWERLWVARIKLESMQAERAIVSETKTQVLAYSSNGLANSTTWLLLVLYLDQEVKTWQMKT